MASSETQPAAGGTLHGHAVGNDAGEIELQLAMIDAASRIVAGPHSSHLIDDPDVAQAVARSFRLVYESVRQAVTTPAVPPSNENNR